MAAQALLIVLAISSCFVKVVYGLYCLQCDDVPSALDCSTMKQCSPYEQCSSGTVGRRSYSSGDLPVCDGCCDSLFCQSNLCQDMGYHKDRGPICFKCDHVASEENCTQIAECGRDEACYSGYTLSAGGSLLTKLGCYPKSSCDRLQASIGSVHSAHSCWDCCTTDLCNTGCGTPATSVTTHAPVTQKTPTAAHCVDITPAVTCQLASAIVCQSRTHAQNADCMHSCGFC